MRIIYEKREVHLYNPSIIELAEVIEEIRSDAKFDDFKIMIDEFDKETDFEWRIQPSE